MGIAQADYTISDVIRLKPAWLKKKQSDVGGFNAILDRVAGMMDHGFNHIAPYKFLSVFGDYDISQKPVNEINKAIIEHKPIEQNTYFEPKLKGNASFIMESAKNGDLNFSPTGLNNKIDLLKNSIRNHEDDIQNYLWNIRDGHNSINQKRQKISEIDVEILSLQDRIDESSGSLDKSKIEILKNIPNHWRITHISKEYFTVIRVTEVIMTETNAGTGANRFLNMGFYGFSFDYSFQTIDKFAVGNHINAGTIHPHVSSYICWGNLGNQKGTAIGERDSAKFFKLLDTLLESYNSGSPFLAYENYNRAKNKKRIHIKKAIFKNNPEVFREMYENCTDNLFKQAIEDYTANHRTSTRIKNGWYTIPLNEPDEEEVGGIVSDNPVIDGDPFQ